MRAVLSAYQESGIDPLIWPRSAGSSPQAPFTRPPLSLAAAHGGLGYGSCAHSVDEYIVIEGNEKVGGIVRAEQPYADILYAYAHWPRT